jgi:hypothetical protein
VEVPRCPSVHILRHNQAKVDPAILYKLLRIAFSHEKSEDAVVVPNFSGERQVV